MSAPAEGALAEFETRLAAVERRLATRRAELHELATSRGELSRPARRRLHLVGAR